MITRKFNHAPKKRPMLLQLQIQQLESLVTLIDHEISANEEHGDDAYNTYWENIKDELYKAQ